MKTATATLNNLLILCLVLACSFVAVASFIRFFVNRDYIVSYEGSCEPQIATCFSGCKNDDCTDTYYFAKVQKYGEDLYTECGDGITSCQQANICLLTDRECSVTYCDAKIDGDACAKAETEADFNSEFPLNKNNT
jgi:hypothetical protein